MTIEKIQHPPVTNYDRAKKVAMKWVCGGVNTSPTAQEKESIKTLATLIYQEFCDIGLGVSSDIS